MCRVCMDDIKNGMPFGVSFFCKGILSIKSRGKFCPHTPVALKGMLSRNFPF